MPRFKFIDFMVIELRFFKEIKKKKMNMDKMWKAHFEIPPMSCITDQPFFVYWQSGYFSHILHLDIIKSEINFKLKVEMNKILIYGFQWG